MKYIQHIKLSSKVLTCLLVLFSVSLGLFAQDNEETKLYTVSGFVVNEQGEPLAGALVTADEEQIQTYTGISGEFSMDIPHYVTITVSTPKYETLHVEYERNLVTDSLVLIKMPFHMTEDDIVNIAFGKTSKRQITGAVSVMDGEDLAQYPTMDVREAMVGLVPGLYVQHQSDYPGISHSQKDQWGDEEWNTNTKVNLRGVGAPIAIVDGVERSLDDINPEEIESITVLKDITAKVMYGSRAGRGVLLVTTRKGKKNSKRLDITFEKGIKQPTYMPKMLNSYYYDSLYQTAAIFDGTQDGYSETVGAYREDTNRIDFPNNDYYGELHNNLMNYNAFTANFSGGGTKSAYFFHAGYRNEGGFIKVGDGEDYHRLNFRGQIDMELNDYISMEAGVAQRVTLATLPNITYEDAVDHHPYDFPMLIPYNADTTFYGAAPGHLENPYGWYEDGGYSKRFQSTSIFNYKLNVDLSQITQGLSASGYFTLSALNDIIQRKDHTFPLYAATMIGDSIATRKVRDEEVFPDMDDPDRAVKRTLGLYGQLAYSRIFKNVHSISADLVYYQKSFEETEVNHHLKNASLGLRANYMFKNKYIVDFALVNMGSTIYSEEQRWFLSPAGGVAWVLSEEGFLSDIDVIDYLKLKASGGVMGYEFQGATYPLYLDDWQTGNQWSFYNLGVVERETNRTPLTMNANRVENPTLEWEKMREINIGMEVSTLKNRLFLDVNYFNNMRYDILAQRENTLPQLQGGILGYQNYGKENFAGIETDIIFSDQLKDFGYSVGANFMYAKSEIVEIDETLYNENEAYRSKVGVSTNAIWGLEYDRSYQNEDDVINSISQAYGERREGDLKYMDLNGDSVVNNADRTPIGVNRPKFTYAVHLNLRYKGFELYVLGTGAAGFDVALKDNEYYWIDGNDRYSEHALKMWTPENASEATYPRLTTGGMNNNYQMSSFWLKDGSYFKIKHAQLSYNLPESWVSKIRMRNAKIFVRGTNLLTISSISELDIEDLNAGYDRYPIFRTFTGGFSVSF